MEAYIQTYSVGSDGQKHSFLTQCVEHKHSPMDFHIKGLQYTVSGYGKRIPTEYMVKWNGKWRRVYCCVFSNSGTLYIGKMTDNLKVQFHG